MVKKGVIMQNRLILFMGVTLSLIGQTPQQLITTFAPLLKFSSKESAFPSSVDWYLNQCELYDNHNNRVANTITSKQLSLCHGKSYKNFYLKPKSRGVYQGMPLQKINGSRYVIAPCYANFIEKDDGAIIQYTFFYPYNDRIPLISTAAQALDFFAGEHEGDWEHINVHITKKNATYHLHEVYYARHSATKYGEYVGTKDLIIVDKTHPVVYVAQHTHASYATNIGINLLGDQTNDDGPKWRCWEYVIDVGTPTNPTPGQEWTYYSGKWGSSDHSPRGPAQVSWWRTGALQFKQILSIAVNFKKEKASDIFSIDGKIPTYIRKLRWSIDNQNTPINFSIIKQGNPLLFIKDKKILGPLLFGTIVAAPKEKTGLFFSNVSGNTTEKTARAVIDLVYE